METQKIQDSKVSNKVGSKLTILVEENIAVRGLWENYFRVNGLALVVFENPLEFLSQLNRFKGLDEQVCFFFDQDFGKIRGVGLELARAVKGLNNRQVISLITNHHPREFKDELRSGQVQSVFGKYPEFIFGEDFETLSFSANMPLILESLLSGRCELEKVLGFYGNHMDFKLEQHFPKLAPKPVIEPCPEPSQPLSKPELVQPLKVSAWMRIYKFLSKPFALPEVSIRKAS